MRRQGRPSRAQRGGIGEIIEHHDCAPRAASVAGGRRTTRVSPSTAVTSTRSPVRGLRRAGLPALAESNVADLAGPVEHLRRLADHGRNSGPDGLSAGAPDIAEGQVNRPTLIAADAAITVQES